MRIAFFGVPDLGVIGLNALMQNNANIVVAIPPSTSNAGYEHMTSVILHNNIPVLSFNKSPREPEFIASFMEFRPDVAIIGAFDNKLPEELIKIPPLGFINFHPSLLPEYRGGNPYFHVILNNEKKTGVTAHYMDESFDTGDIITQSETDIAGDETFGTLLSKLNSQSAEMMIEIVKKLENGESLPRKKQIKEGDFKTAPIIRPSKGDNIIDWSKDAFYINRFVRACNPIYATISSFRGNKIAIWAGMYSENNKNINIKPGTIVNVSRDSIAVATGKGLFFPTVIQCDYFITDIKDFIRRAAVKAGESFNEI